MAYLSVIFRVAAFRTTSPFLAMLPTDEIFGAADDVEDVKMSGCTPGSEQLPDGIWFGFVDYWDYERVGFDLACFYGIEVTDFETWVWTNDNTTVREIPWASDAVGYPLDRQTGAQRGPVSARQMIDDPGVPADWILSGTQPVVIVTQDGQVSGLRILFTS